MTRPGMASAAATSSSTGRTTRTRPRRPPDQPRRTRSARASMDALAPNASSKARSTTVATPTSPSATTSASATATVLAPAPGWAPRTLVKDPLDCSAIHAGVVVPDRCRRTADTRSATATGVVIIGALRSSPGGGRVRLPAAGVRPSTACAGLSRPCGRDGPHSPTPRRSASRSPSRMVSNRSATHSTSPASIGRVSGEGQFCMIPSSAPTGVEWTTITRPRP